MDSTNLLLTEVITKVHSHKLYLGLSEPTFGYCLCLSRSFSVVLHAKCY